MATWNELNAEARALGTTFDIVRRKYLRQPADRDRTGENAAAFPSTEPPAYRLIENQDGLSLIQAEAPNV